MGRCVENTIMCDSFTIGAYVLGLPSIKKAFYFEAPSTRDMTTDEVVTFRCNYNIM